MKEATERDMMSIHKPRDVRGAHLSVPHHADTRPIQHSNDHTLIDVEFHILSTLPCKDPIIVKREWETN